jgi:hypothetical protein
MTGRLLAGTSVVALAVGLAAGAAQAQVVTVPPDVPHILIDNDTIDAIEILPGER